MRGVSDWTDYSQWKTPEEKADLAEYLYDCWKDRRILEAAFSGNAEAILEAQRKGWQIASLKLKEPTPLHQIADWITAQAKRSEPGSGN